MPLVKDRDRLRSSVYQKWDYITLTDYQARSCWTVLSYIWLWFLAIIAVAVCAADTFTAINLLAFNRWSSQISPAIPISTSKWIFAACILFSWALYLFEWIRAIRVIRRGNVADSYLDPLAVTLQSIRPDQNWSGWRRFLVFAELTKSKKGADYVALFAYFQFKSAIRILLAEGPRQAVNALTLYSVMQANLIPVGAHAASDGHTAFVQFFYNLQLLADEHTLQAVILLSMLFTLVIWAISMLSFIAACVLFAAFLSHYIPSSDGTLSRYCRRKIDNRLGRIADNMFKKALKQQDGRRRQHQQGLMENGGKPALQLTDGRPSRPPVPEKDAAVLGLNRPVATRIPADETLLKKSSFRVTERERLNLEHVETARIEDAPPRPGYLTRTGTHSTQHSKDSFDSDEILLSNVATMGTSVVTYDHRPLDMPYSPMEMNELPSRVVAFADSERGSWDAPRPSTEHIPPPYSRTTTDGPQQLPSYPGVWRKPLPAYPQNDEDFSQSDTSAMPMPLKPKPTAAPNSYGLPPAPDTYVRQSSASQPQYPTRNFSLLHRRQQTPDMYAAAQPSASQAPPTNDINYSTQSHPPSAYAPYQSRVEPQTYYIKHTYIPSQSQPPSPPRERQYVREPSTGSNVPILQNPPQRPRRNATMPETQSEKFNPPHRSATNPQQSQAYPAEAPAQTPAYDYQYGKRSSFERSTSTVPQQETQPHFAPPRRNMTMPTTSTSNLNPDSNEHNFAPPRRVVTEPIQSQSQQQQTHPLTFATTSVNAPPPRQERQAVQHPRRNMALPLPTPESSDMNRNSDRNRERYGPPRRAGTDPVVSAREWYAGYRNGADVDVEAAGWTGPRTGTGTRQEMYGGRGRLPHEEDMDGYAGAQARQHGYGYETRRVYRYD